MSKTVKNMIMRDYTTRMGAVEEALVIGVRGLNAKDTHKLRSGLAKKQMKVTVVRNSLAKKTFESGKLKPLTEFFSESTALAYGGASIIELTREVVELTKAMPKVELRAAILDGAIFKGKAGVTELSKFPTKDEAIGQIVTLVISPARKLATQLLGPGRTVAGLVKAIEAKLEKGEAIAKAG
jgi:ribosomal protein L10